MPLAVFRCDADPRLGAGHVVRCLALAEALALDDWEIGFAVSNETTSVVPQLRDQSWQIAAGFGGARDPALFRSAWPGGADLIVIDHYGIDAAYESALSSWARRRLVIDDLADRPHACEVLLDQGFRRTADDYARLVPAGCSLLLGPAYALLRSDFARTRSRRAGHRPSGNVVVAMGMFDHRNASRYVLQALAWNRFAGTAHVLLGARAPHLDDLRRTAAACEFQTRFLTDAGPAETTATLLDAELAIGSGGVSALERCCLGIPALLVEVANNQRDNVSALAERGAARKVEWTCLQEPSCLGAAVANLLAEPSALSAMSSAGRLLVDGRGAGRIALALRPERTKSDAAVTLRPARAGDVDLLFAWQTEPEARRHSRNPTPPTRPEHEAWLTRTLADPAVLFCIVLVDGTPAGNVRLAPVADGQDLYEVSVLISEKFRGQGVAAAALRSLHRLAPEASVDAHVLEGNAVSHRLFRSLGYVPVAGRYRYTPGAARHVSAR